MALSEKDKLVREIAKDLYVREDVVRDVLDRFHDIAVEKIVNDGKFRYSKFFTITSKKYKEYSNNHGIVPEHYRLSIKLSASINELFKRKQRINTNVSKDNWRTISEDKIDEQDKTISSSIDEEWNPLLDEDD